MFKLKVKTWVLAGPFLSVQVLVQLGPKRRKIMVGFMRYLPSKAFEQRVFLGIIPLRYHQLRG